MPNAASSDHLIRSDFVTQPATFVDVRRFYFFKETNFDVRALPTQEIDRLMSSASPQHSERRSPPRGDVMVAVSQPQTMDTAANANLASSTSLLLFRPHPPLPAAVAAVSSSFSSSLHGTSSAALVTSSVGAELLTPVNRARAAKGNERLNVRPLFSASGTDIIWAAGRSLALEQVDRHAQRRVDFALDSHSVPPTPLPPGVVAATGSSLTSPSAPDLVIRVPVLERGPTSQGPSAWNVVPAAAFGVTTVNKGPVPRSPRTVLNGITAHIPVSSASDSARSRRPAPDAVTASSGNRHTSDKAGGGNRLAQQLAEQSHSLKERLDALRAADEIHRGRITQMGATLLASLGYVDEMKAFQCEQPPLPHGAHYAELHSIDLVREVRQQQQDGEGGEATGRSGGGPSVASALISSESANEAARWISVLKLDVAAAAAHEEALRTKKPVAKPPSVLSQGRNRRGPTTVQQHAGRHGSPTGPLSLPKIVFDEAAIATLAEEHLQRALYGPSAQPQPSQARRGGAGPVGGSAALPPAKATKYSDAADAQEELEDDTIKQLLLSEEIHAKREEGKSTLFSGERAARKRGAITTANPNELDVRIGDGGSADVRLLGSSAVVDVTLYRKNPVLFAINGEDTDPKAFPSFPFHRDELLRPRKEGFGISLLDGKKTAEDKAFSGRYHQANLSDKLERTHVVRRLLNKIVTRQQREAEGGGVTHSPNPGDAGVTEVDEDEKQMASDLEQWKRAAGEQPPRTSLHAQDERITSEMKYIWLQTSQARGVEDISMHRFAPPLKAPTNKHRGAAEKTLGSSGGNTREWAQS